jgi:hypothetical protein
MVRTQLGLADAMHRRLRELARRQGRTISDLVRDALVRTYGRDDLEQQRASSKAIVGLWADRKDIGDTEEY